VPWGMYFPLDPTQSLRHPSQLYEALLEGIVLFIVMWLIREKSKFDGFLLGIYICGYGLARFIAEFFREPDYNVNIILTTISIGQLLCLIMMLSGIALLIWRKNTAQALPQKN
jgi:phosphatidylglycerol:prolipoprotein diacylglycerol transferase